MVDQELMKELTDGTFTPSEKREPLEYLVGVCEIDEDGRICGTHNVTSTVAFTLEDAKAWALRDIALHCYGTSDTEDLHVLFVMTTPVGVVIDVVEYDEGAP